MENRYEYYSAILGKLDNRLSPEMVKKISPDIEEYSIVIRTTDGGVYCSFLGEVGMLKRVISTIPEVMSIASKINDATIN